MFILAAVTLVATPKSNAQALKQKAGEVRILTFPKTASLGVLYLIPYDGPNIGGSVPVGAAFGTVKVAVAKTNQWLALELNRHAFENPNLLDACSATGLDALNFTFMSMDDSENSWCDAALQHANHFQNLKCLIINRSDVSDAGMSRLKPQPSLERIIGFLTDIKGDCFKTFSRHPNLQGLDFYDCGIKEENLKYLAACPKLTYVDFHHTDMGEIGIKYLSQCANLSEVHVKNNARINDACLKYLLNLKHLSYLELDSTGVTFNGLKVLKPLKLNKLTISEGVCEVKDLPALKTLAKTIEIVPRSHKVDKRMQQMLAPLH